MKEIHQCWYFINIRNLIKFFCHLCNLILSVMFGFTSLLLHFISLCTSSIDQVMSC